MIQQILRPTEMMIVRIRLIIILLIQARDNDGSEERRVPGLGRLSESFNEQLYALVVVECAFDVGGGLGAAGVVAACEGEEAVHYHWLVEGETGDFEGEMAGVVACVGLEGLDVGFAGDGNSYERCEFVDVCHEEKSFSFCQLEGLVTVALYG
jgi:hypothetical protein